jgi:hypothetical protein
MTSRNPGFFAIRNIPAVSFHGVSQFRIFFSRLDFWNWTAPGSRLPIPAAFSAMARLQEELGICGRCRSRFRARGREIGGPGQNRRADRPDPVSQRTQRCNVWRMRRRNLLNVSQIVSPSPTELRWCYATAYSGLNAFATALGA